MASRRARLPVPASQRGHRGERADGSRRDARVAISRERTAGGRQRAHRGHFLHGDARVTPVAGRRGGAGAVEHRPPHQADAAGRSRPTFPGAGASKPHPSLFNSEHTLRPTGWVPAPVHGSGCPTTFLSDHTQQGALAFGRRLRLLASDSGVFAAAPSFVHLEDDRTLGTVFFGRVNLDSISLPATTLTLVGGHSRAQSHGAEA